MTDLAVLIGLQASGKSTFYRRHLAGTHALVSKDLLRNNRRPARRQAALVSGGLSAGRSVAVDNTNPTVELRKELKVDPELPMKDEYGLLVARLLGAESRGTAMIREPTTISVRGSRSSR